MNTYNTVTFLDWLNLFYYRLFNYQMPVTLDFMFHWLPFICMWMWDAENEKLKWISLLFNSSLSVSRNSTCSKFRLTATLTSLKLTICISIIFVLHVSFDAVTYDIIFLLLKTEHLGSFYNMKAFMNPLTKVILRKIISTNKLFEKYYFIGN